jgi:hypothetical protein
MFDAAKQVASDRSTQITSAPSAVTRGLDALIELMAIPGVRAAVLTFQTDFQATSDQIHVLADYKRLHDLLHTLQFHCYSPIVQEAKKFPEDETARDNLNDHQLTLQRVVDDLRDIVSRASFPTDETSWINNLQQAQTEMCEAIESNDAKLLMKATWRVNRVLAIQPSQINTRLNDAARGLRLAALVDGMKIVHENLARLDVDRAKMNQFEIGVTALAGLSQSLGKLVHDHDSWQALDCELRRIEANLEKDMGELEWAWPEFKTKTVLLYGSSLEDWAKSLKADGEKLDAAIVVQDRARVKQHFRSYYRRAADRFYRVDMSLKGVCEDFRKVGEPLASVLRMTH